MTQFIVTFSSELEQLAAQRTNGALKNILNVLDWADLPHEDKTKLRKIILDEVNGLTKDMIEYFKKTQNGD